MKKERKKFPKRTYFIKLAVIVIPFICKLFQPNIAPNKRRPNFVWKPHGVTPFPFATEIPQAIAINDKNELTFGGPPAVADAAAAAAPCKSTIAT